MITPEGFSLDLPVTDRPADHSGETVRDVIVPDATVRDVSLPDIASLVHAYSTILFRVAHSILRSPSEAEDVVQETFLRVVQTAQRKATLADIRDPRVWLIRITWNLALDRRRAIRADQMDDVFAATLIASSLAPDAALAEQRNLRLILTEIERLPAKERHVLLLSAMEELSTPEIAAILNRSESAVRSLLHRARTRLRDRIEARPAKGAR